MVTCSVTRYLINETNRFKMAAKMAVMYTKVCTRVEKVKIHNDITLIDYRGGGGYHNFEKRGCD